MILIPAVASPSVGQEGSGRQREQIGQVLGKPVYRDQIETGKDVDLQSEVHRLFAFPVLEKYRREHKAEITPTETEIEAATAYFDKWHSEQIRKKEPKLRRQLKTIKQQLSRPGLTKPVREQLEFETISIETELKPPGREFAHFLVDHWKFERHLYDRFGGGRILWQQAGMEAFDAMRNWLQTQERDGTLRIADANFAPNSTSITSRITGRS